MSMYEMVFGPAHEKLPILQRLLGEGVDVGRFRDLWLEKWTDSEESKMVLAVYTRNGGGNREEYAEVITALQAHPLYLRDEDDSFDSTYATFYFTLDMDQLDDLELAVIAENEWPHVDTAAKWQEALAALENGAGK